jgi:hypothetical protein
MNHKEYIQKVRELESQLQAITREYVDSYKKYNEGDYLKVSFHSYDGRYIQKTCKIVSIYPQNTSIDLNRWPTGELIHFARYAWKDESGNIVLGDACRLGPLSQSNHVCGFSGIDWNDVKIEVIQESDLITNET